METVVSKKVYEFDRFRLDPNKRLLSEKDTGQIVQIAPKALDLLLALVRNSGQLLSKRELMDAVWSDSFVEEANLAQNISVLRRTLGESRHEHAFIVTEPGRGYRFVARVIEIDPDNAVEQNFFDGDSDVTEVSDAGLVDSECRTPQNPSASTLQIMTRPSVLGPIVLIVGILLAVYVLRSESGAIPMVAVQEIKSIAVLPFEAINAEGDDESIGAGLSETLIVKLSNSKSLLVKRPGTLIGKSDSTPDPVKIGTELKTDAVLEGTVQKANDRVRLTVRLVRVSDGTSMWAESFDDKFTNVFALQDSISEKVVDALSVRLTGVERQRLSKRYTENSQAYQQYLRGKFHWNKYTAEGFQKAAEHLNRAIELDPGYALAYAGLADTYMMLAVESYRDPREVCPQARSAAEKALSIDPELSEAHTSIGIYEIFCGYDWPRAESAFKRAIEMNPQNPDARHFYCHFLQGMNRHDEAIAQINEALKIEPFSLIVNAETGWAYYLAHRFDEALPLLRQAKDMEPDFFLTYLPLAQTYIQKGIYPEAIAELKRAAELSGNHPAIRSELACAYALSGRRSEAVKILREFESQAGREFFDPYFIAVVYLALDEKDKAIEWLERSYQVRSNWLLWMNTEPKLDPIRNDPRFQELTATIYRSELVSRASDRAVLTFDLSR